MRTGDQPEEDEEDVDWLAEADKFIGLAENKEFSFLSEREQQYLVGLVRGLREIIEVNKAEARMATRNLLGI